MWSHGQLPNRSDQGVALPSPPLGFRDLGFRDLGFRDLGFRGLGFRDLGFRA